MKNIFFIDHNSGIEEEFNRIITKYSEHIKKIEEFESLLNLDDSQVSIDSDSGYLLANFKTLKSSLTNLEKTYFELEKRTYLNDLIRSYFHEFNNNFSIILGYIDYANILDDFQEVKKSLSKSLVSLEEELENTSKLHKFIKNSSIGNTDFDVISLLDEVLNIFQIYKSDKEINISFNKDYFIEIFSNYGTCQYILYKIFTIIYELIDNFSDLKIDIKEGRKLVTIKSNFKIKEYDDKAIENEAFNKIERGGEDNPFYIKEILKIKRIVKIIKGNFKTSEKNKGVNFELDLSKNLNI